MQFEAFSGSPAAQRSGCLVIGMFEDRQSGELAQMVDRAQRGALARLLGRGDFAGRAGETLLLAETP